MLMFSDNLKAAPAIFEETAEFGRLAQLVREVTGFRDGPGLRCKLRSIVGGADEDTANTWLRRLSPRWVSSGEWQAVLERLMVPETFFFRDGPQIRLLQDTVLPAMVANKVRTGNRSIRIWSAGCSTGEEPYTLAMLTLDTLVAAGQAVEMPGVGIQPNPGWVVHIYGTDINAKVIDQARIGSYSDLGLSAFRETPPQFRRFFIRHEPANATARHEIRADVRNVTCFGVHNLKTGSAGSAFDLVSCRNVMIYFDDDSKRLALNALSGAVGRNGYLILGSTDSFDELGEFKLLDSRVSPILGKAVPSGRGK